MSTRDELAETISVALRDNTPWDGYTDISDLGNAMLDSGYDLLAVADTVLADYQPKPRTVDTIEEALALPQGTVIQSSPTVCPRAGEISVGISDQRHYVFWAGNECEDELAAWMLPFTVLFIPEATA